YYGSTSSAQPKAEHSLIGKLDKIIEELGLLEKVKDKHVLVKIHLGQNIGFTNIHPFITGYIVRKIKKAGGKPFLVDIFEQIEKAPLRGYTLETIGCPIYPVAGPKDQYYVEKEVNFKGLKVIQMGGLCKDADILLDLSHVKGHNTAGFGAALKNLALGCYTQKTRWGLHGTMQYDKYWFPEKCSDIKKTVDKFIKACPYGCIKYQDDKLRVEFNLCNQCMRCVKVDDEGCLKIQRSNFEAFFEGMAITTEFVLEHFDEDSRFFINIGLDITEYCDCWGFTTGNILPDIGILGSKDILAIDKATLDLLKDKPLIEENVSMSLEINNDPRLHPFARIHGPWKDPYLQIYYGKKYGLGNPDYELVEVLPPGERKSLSLPEPSFPEPLELDL
ncbi:hypothetical protein DRO38_07190, partial [Candidatus Bathyarchaeota archaeon]